MNTQKTFRISVFIILVLGLFIIISNVASAALTDNIISYYKYDSNAADSLGVASGSVTGAVQVPGKINNAYAFDNNDYIDSSYNFFNYDFSTIAFWARINNTYIDLRNDVFYDSKSGTNPYKYLFQKASNGDLQLFCNGASVNAYTSASPPSWWVQGNWVHLAVICDDVNNRVLLYVNGALDKNISLSFTKGATDTLRIGAYAYGGGGFNNATIDEIGIWSRQLTGAEISQLYNSGTGLSYPFGAAPAGSFSINFNGSTPASGSYVLNNYFPVNVSTNATVNNITIFLYNASGSLVASEISGTGVTLFTKNFTGLSDGVYYFNATAWNNSVNVSTSTRYVTLDTANPVVNVYEPTTGSRYSSNNIYFNASVSDTNYANSSVTVWRVNNVIGDLTTVFTGSTTNSSILYSLNLPNSQYGYKAEITSYDVAGRSTTQFINTFYTDFLNVSFISQSPTDINTSNLFSTRLNLTYNISSLSTNLSNTFLNFSTIGGSFCTNGTCYSGYNTDAYDVNYSDRFSFLLNDNQIYPATYNINETLMEKTIHNRLSLNMNSDYVLIELLNVSSAKAYNQFEIDLNTSGGVAEIYYCNSSYTTGNVGASPYCALFGTYNGSSFNHLHNQSHHNIFSLPIVAGAISGVTVTPTSYFIVRGASTGMTSIGYINDTSRVGAIKTSLTSGSAYTNETYTVDAHLHQYSGTEYLYYQACSSNLVSSLCSIFRNDTLDVTPLPPTAPEITSPTDSQNVSEYLNITWNPSVPFNASFTISSYTVYLLNADLSTNRTLNTTSATSYYWNTYLSNLSIGQYYIRVLATDSAGRTSFDISDIFNIVSDAKINITTSNYTGQAINNFNFTLTDTVTGISTDYVVTSGVQSVDIVKYRNYTVFFDTARYAYSTNILNKNISYSTQDYTLYPENSINIHIRDEVTNALITQNVTLLFERVGSAASYTYDTVTGEIFPEGLIAGNYTLTLRSLTPIAYNVRYYNIEVLDRTTQDLTAYLNNGGTTLLTYRNQRGELLPGVDVVVQRVINGTFVTVESLTTQIDGRTQFNYLGNTRYRIISTLSAYDELTFELNPVLFTSYDVTMYPFGTDRVEPSAYATWDKSSFYKGQTGNITFKIFSPYSSLVTYTVTTRYNGVQNYTYTGNVAPGEVIYIPYTTSNAHTGDTYTIFYSYELNNNATQNFTNTYNIVVPLTNRTLMNMGTDFYGLGTGDRILIVVFLNILAFGVGFLVAGTSLGSILMMGNSLIFINNGFVPAGVFYATIVIGVLLIMGRGINDG